MKFSFEAELDYQRQAIDAVTGLFQGQETMASQFTVYAHPAARLGMQGEGFTDRGYGNMLRLDPETILENLHEVQERTGLPPEPSLESMNFTIEMETGTGKTYVYLRTIYELHDIYGFTKFMVVVPSIAIKEGVLASIGMLRDHLGNLYGNPPVSTFAFDGSNPSRVRTFAASPAIEIMVVTIAALNKGTNKVYQPAEDLDFEVPADLIRATRPIIIVDEPQSVYGDSGDGRRTGAGRAALEKFGALATLRYSATHHKNDRANLVYRLDAIAAYDKQLVKQIEVDSLVATGSGAAPYARLAEVRRGRGGKITARLELDVEQATGVKRKVVSVEAGVNLEDVTRRSRYKDLAVSSITATAGQESVRFDTVAEALRVGDTIGAEISIDERARQMIAQTIRQHLLKELEFATRNRQIKVLSLIFVDAVAKYRVYGPKGEPLPGPYAKIFEEEYERIAAEPEFSTLLTRPADAIAREAHQGYFSKDRHKDGTETFVDTSEKSEKGRQQATLAYHQIMVDKVALTTPGTSIRFIFSHSALQEGWDNPNVFQLCVLRNMGTERWRRQSIGRGLRLCVDGSGNRVRGFDVNRLTVIANESYEEFADRLQREMADDLGITFGVVAEEALAALTYKDSAGNVLPVNMATAQTLFQALIMNGYIDGKGKVQEPLRAAVQDDNPELATLIEGSLGAPDAVAAILGYIKRLARPITIKKSSERVRVPVVEGNLTSPEFAWLWEGLRHRSEYRVVVGEDTLRATLMTALHTIKVPARRAEWTRRVVTGIDQKGLSADIEEIRRVDVTYADSEELPDILSILADRTQLTRATLAYVLTHVPGTLDLFKANPQAYMDKAAHALNDAKRNYLLDGLRYQLIDADRPEEDRRYDLNLFREANLSGYTGAGGKVLCDEEGQPVPIATRSVYEYLLHDSALEAAVALDLLHRDGVALFVKLPPDFKLPTPLGGYNPDWAILVTDPDGGRRVVVETKPHSQPGLLRPEEEGKTKAARLHFAMITDALALAITYDIAESIDDVIVVLEGRSVG